MMLTAEELDTDIVDLRLISNNIAFAMSDPTLRQQVEAERDRIISAIETIRRVLTQDEQAGIRRLSEQWRALRDGSAA